jgi:hypothetical protein
MYNAGSTTMYGVQRPCVVWKLSDIPHMLLASIRINSIELPHVYTFIFTASGYASRDPRGLVPGRMRGFSAIKGAGIARCNNTVKISSTLPQFQSKYANDSRTYERANGCQAAVALLWKRCDF